MSRNGKASSWTWKTLSGIKAILNSSVAMFRVPVAQAVSPTTASNTNARTFTAAEILGKLITRDPNGADRSDVFPDATNIIASLGGSNVVASNASIDFFIKNNADADETVTMTTSGTNSGITLSGNMRIPAGLGRFFTLRVTGTNTVTIYDQGLDADCAGAYRLPDMGTNVVNTNLTTNTLTLYKATTNSAQVGYVGPFKSGTNNYYFLGFTR